MEKRSDEVHVDLSFHFIDVLVGGVIGAGVMALLLGALGPIPYCK